MLMKCVILQMRILEKIKGTAGQTFTSESVFFRNKHLDI